MRLTLFGSRPFAVAPFALAALSAIAVGAFLGSAVPPAGAAEGLRTLPDTARAMGMAGGRLVLLDDASVVRTNPASLPEIQDTLATVSYQAWHGKVDYTSPLGARDSMRDPWKHLGSVYVAHPLSDTLTAGLGISAPFGVSIKWPEEGAFRYAGASEAVLATYAINPALGLKINDEVSVGFGLDIFRSDIELRQRYPWGAVTGLPVPDGSMRFEGDGWGLGAYLGVNYKIDSRQRVSVVGRLPVSVSYSGEFAIDHPMPPLAVPPGPFDSEIKYPGSIAVGYAVDLSERFSLGIDFEWIQNSTHDRLPLGIGPNQPLLGGFDAIPMGWDDSFSIGIGGLYRVNEALTLRAGYLYSDSPMSDRTWNPSVPSDDRHILSVGAGYAFGDHSIDLAYSLVLMSDTTVRDNVVPAFNGSYSHDWSVLTLSYTRRF